MAAACDQIQAQGVQNLLGGGQFLLGAKNGVSHAQLLQAQAQWSAVPPRDDRGGDARLLQQFDAMAIQGVKALEGFARFTEVQAAIGEHPIDIEKRHAHRLGL